MVDKSHQAICVYCASSADIDKSYVEGAYELGRLIAKSGHPLVCGAGRTGLMAAVTEGALREGGETIGVIPRFMVENGWQHPGLSRLEITQDMHQRKKRMAELSLGVIALPGGCGTLEELLEIITWKQLGLYDGNVVILNCSGYYDQLLGMLGHAMEEGFIKKDHVKIWQVASTPQSALDMALCPDSCINISSKY